MFALRNFVNFQNRVIVMHKILLYRFIFCEVAGIMQHLRLKNFMFVPSLSMLSRDDLISIDVEVVTFLFYCHVSEGIGQLI